MNQGYKNIDDLFRSEFKDFELDPPEHVWENVKNSIPGSGRNNPFYRFRYGGIIGLSSILILAGLFSYQYFTRTAEIEPNTFTNNTAEKEMNIQVQEPVAEISAKDDIAVVEFSNNNNEPSKKAGAQQTTTTTDLHQEKPVVKTGISKIEVPGSNLLTDNSASDTDLNTTVSSFGTKPPVAVEDNLLAMANGNDQAPVTSLPESYNTENNFNLRSSSGQDFTLEGSSSASSEPAEPEFKSDYGKKGNILLGLTFTPEITFFPSDNQFTNRSYSVDGSVVYKFSGYMIQSGIGVRFASDDGHYKVDYQKFLGTYEDVYDVTFDTTANGLEPVYHTQTVEVYDSVLRVSLTPTKNRYTYLQIPLLFGYGEDYKRVSWFVKGGPSLAVLIHEGQPSVDFNNGNNKILNSETELPSRLNTNWSFVLSAGIGYKLGNHVSITLEPSMRFYMKSAYEQNVITTKHPYSFGLRTGLLFGF